MDFTWFGIILCQESFNTVKDPQFFDLVNKNIQVLYRQLKLAPFWFVHSIHLTHWTQPTSIPQNYDEKNIIRTRSIDVFDSCLECLVFFYRKIDESVQSNMFLSVRDDCGRFFVKMYCCTITTMNPSFKICKTFTKI